MTAQGSAYMRFRRALDRGNVTEALSAASEIQFVRLAEALELTLLLADEEPDKFGRAAGRWTARFLQEVPTWMSERAKRCSPSSRRYRQAPQVSRLKEKALITPAHKGEESQPPRLVRTV